MRQRNKSAAQNRHTKKKNDAYSHFGENAVEFVGSRHIRHLPDLPEEFALVIKCTHATVGQNLGDNIPMFSFMHRVHTQHRSQQRHIHASAVKLR